MRLQALHKRQGGSRLALDEGWGLEEAAKILFGNLHVERWAFDVELLYLAERLRIPILEEAVRWREVDGEGIHSTPIASPQLRDGRRDFAGSKVTPVLSWLQMGRDLILIWFWYFTGAWTVDPSPALD